MGARFLDDEARAAFAQAVESIEGASAVEVVIAVRRRSAGYLHANLIVGAAIAFAALAVMLFSSASFGLTAILVDPFLVGAGAGGLVELLPQVKRWLTPRAVRSRHVHHAARAAFVDRGVHNTMDRSGLLVYISWLEQQVALVADSGLDQALPPETIQQAEAALTAGMRRGGAAVARDARHARRRARRGDAPPGGRHQRAPRRDRQRHRAASVEGRGEGPEGPGVIRGVRARPTALAILLVLACLAELALARPGGGDSFSGGGGHGGSGGGDGAAMFELIYWLVRLTIYYPQVGLPLLGIVIGAVMYSAYKQQKNKDWDSGPPVTLKRAVNLDPMRRVDPEFSQVLFEDFAFRLFSTAHRARHSYDALAAVAPYVSPEARQALHLRAPGQTVESVVVGAMRTFRVEIPPHPVDEQGRPNRIRIGVEFEANVTTKQATSYSVETWMFGRDATQVSRPPGRSKGFPCPNCGAPWQANATGTQVCASCGQVVDNGRFDWVVEKITVGSADQRPPTLTKEVPERGTDLSTYRQPDVDQQWHHLQADDPALTEQNLVARLNMIYRTLNTAWSSNDLRPVRGLVSDGLYDYLQYWVDAFKRQRLRNQLTDMGITHTIVAKVTRDKWFDAVTIRVWAKGKDFVINTDTGKLVRGSKSRPRAYSEYWTLIRSRGRRGAPIPTPSCGNCGAPLNITMAGACEHCGAHVTAGEFDWVLSKIEQDDTYRG